MAGRVDGPGARSMLLCGAYELGRAHAHPLLAELPEFVHLPAQAGGHTPLRSVVDLLVAEVAGQPLGSDAAVPALLDTMLLFLLRAWLDEPRERENGWAAAVSDPAVAGALRAVHDDPAHAWSVCELAARATVSRATLTRRFAATIGEPPLSYLARWRMLLAAQLLRDTADPLAAVARAVGGSEFAFAKAFKRHHGIAPGAYRRQPVQLQGTGTLAAALGEGGAPTDMRLWSPGGRRRRRGSLLTGWVWGCAPSRRARWLPGASSTPAAPARQTRSP